MIFVAGLTLAFYLMQQFGMMLGFGAEMVLLFTYLAGRRKGVINETEDGIAHGIYHILVFSLCFIIISGVGITGIHFASLQFSVLASPAFVIKWILIIIAAVLAFLLRGFRIWNSALEGISGANWGALFLLHIFAPITTYFVLIKLYIEFVAVFLILWYLVIVVLRLKPAVMQKVAPARPQTTTAEYMLPQQSFFFQLQSFFTSLSSIHLPFLKQSAPPAATVKTEPATPKIPTQPQPIIFSPERTTELPPIHVMPQSEEELLQRNSREGDIKEV